MMAIDSIVSTYNIMVNMLKLNKISIMRPQPELHRVTLEDKSLEAIDKLLTKMGYRSEKSVSSIFIKCTRYYKGDVYIEAAMFVKQKLIELQVARYAE